MDEILPFPFPAIVGQPELKTALILALVNPQIGGVLLLGPYGVGKTTAVRSLLDVMPASEQEELNENGEIVRRNSQMRLIELPLNARMEDVVGGVNERVALEQQRVVIDEGVLARAHRNLLYIDEVNLLDARVLDAILDAAAQGRTFVRRGPTTRLFPSQFVLVGSMNPQEGALRPQILDRFGLRVWVTALTDPADRIEVYRRARAFRENPESFRAQHAAETHQLRDEIAAAREVLTHVTIPAAVEQYTLDALRRLRVPSHRAEIALFEAARARAAADWRVEVTAEDVRRVAPAALRDRRSAEHEQMSAHVAAEDTAILRALDPPRRTRKPPAPRGG